MTEPAPDTTTTTTRRRPPQLAHLVCCEAADRSLCGRHLDGPAFIADRIARSTPASSVSNYASSRCAAWSPASPADNARKR